MVATVLITAKLGVEINGGDSSPAMILESQVKNKETISAPASNNGADAATNTADTATIGADTGINSADS